MSMTRTTAPTTRRDDSGARSSGRGTPYIKDGRRRGDGVRHRGWSRVSGGRRDAARTGLPGTIRVRRRIVGLYEALPPAEQSPQDRPRRQRKPALLLIGTGEI